jgi:hypothetical protein
MGGGKSSTSTQSVSIPPEVLARYNAVNARAENVAQQPFQQYGGEFVAPLTPTQTAGIENTSAASQLAQPYYGAATQGLLGAQQGGANYIGAATGAALAGAMPVSPSGLQVGRYMNPYTENVVGATQAAMNQQQGQQLSQQQSEAIRAGAFGGDRAGLQRQALRGQQSLAQSQAIAPLYQQGYQQALQTAQQQQGVGLGAEQANRQAVQQLGQQLGGLGQQGYAMGAGASQQLAGLGTGAQQAALQGAQAQIGAGTLQQQTQQAQDTAQYQQFLQQRGYDFQVAQFLANIAMGTGALSGSTTTSTQPRGFFSNRGGFKTGESLQRAGKAYGGGLDPNSMGGAVYEPGAFERGGYATAGSVVDATDLSAILAQQRQSFGPFAAAGPYGQAAGATPHGPGGIVPQQQMHVPKLVTAGPPPKQAAGVGSDLSKLYSMGNEAAKDLTGKGLTERASEKIGFRDSAEKIAEAKGADMPGASANATTGSQNPVGGVAPTPTPRDLTATAGEEGLLDKAKNFFGFEHGGGVMPRHYYADGGGDDSQADEAIPYDPSDVQGGKDPMEGVLKAGGQKPQMLKPSGGGGGGGGGGLGGDIAKGLAMAKTAASLFAMSDKRLKDNVRPVGKTFDGQNIYSYNLGDKPTQLGLIAQEVRSKHPDAVGHRGKYLTVNYDEATQNAANRGHFYEGGIVPRQHFEGGGDAEQPVRKYFDYLTKEKGYEPQVAAGILGNAYHESSGLQPGIVGDEGKSIGLFQFHEKGEQPAFRQWASENQRDIADPYAQLDFVHNQLQGPYAKTLNQMRSAADPSSAAESFMRGYERPKEGPTAALDRRQAYANAIASGEKLPTFRAYSGNQAGLGGAGQEAIQRATSGEGNGLGGAKHTSFIDGIGFNKQTILPLLQGIGAMASSKSISPWAAALQGLGAGAKAYGEEETRQAGVEREKAGTTSTLSNIPIGNMIGTFNPKTGQIEYAPRPKYFAPDAFPPKKTGLEKAQEEAIQQGKAATGLIKPSTEGGRYTVDVEPGQTANREFSEYGYRGSDKDAYVVPSTIGTIPALAKRAADDQAAAQERTKAGAMVPQTRLETNMLVDSVLGISPYGFTGDGPNQSARARAVNLYNWGVKNIFGGPAEIEKENVTSSQIINKLTRQLGAQFAGAAGFHASGLADALKDAQISGELTKEASIKLASSMYVRQQMEEDFSKYYNNYMKKYGTAYNVQNNFAREMGNQYEEEKKSLQRALTPVEKEGKWSSPVMELRKNPALAPQFDAYFKKPGLARMLLGG